MFFVLTERVIKMNTLSQEKFSPRTANRTSYHISGPFSKLALAERAAVSALATHTCLNAQVLDLAGLEELKTQAGHNPGLYALGDDIRRLLKRLNAT